MKFTPERLQQIKNLVERGKSRAEIAGILDVTVGSLQVTCSKLGISLRRPKIHSGVSLQVKHTPLSEHARHQLQSTEEQSQGNSQSEPLEPPIIAKPQQERVNTLEASWASVAIRFQYRGMERTAELPLTLDMIGQLALEAALRDVKIDELITELITAMVKKGLFALVLDNIEPRHTEARQAR